LDRGLGKVQVLLLCDGAIFGGPNFGVTSRSYQMRHLKMQCGTKSVNKNIYGAIFGPALLFQQVCFETRKATA
jgi:hypothetical protein